VECEGGVGMGQDGGRGRGRGGVGDGDERWMLGMGYCYLGSQIDSVDDGCKPSLHINQPPFFPPEGV